MKYSNIASILLLMATVIPISMELQAKHPDSDHKILSTEKPVPPLDRAKFQKIIDGKKSLRIRLPHNLDFLRQILVKSIVDLSVSGSNACRSQV